MDKKLTIWLLVAAVAVVIGPYAQGALADDAPDPVGTWEWSFETRNGQLFEMSVKIETKDDNFVGAFTGPRGDETPVDDLKLEEDELTFTVTRERNGQEFVISYQGKLSADAITGTSLIDFDGQSREREWEATRAGAELAGTWTVMLTTPNGQEIERTLKLEQEGDKLSGTYATQFGDVELKDAKVNGAGFSFVIAIDRDGQEITIKYNGKQSGDTIEGTIDFDFGGQTGTLDFNGERATEEDAAEEEEE